MLTCVNKAEGGQKLVITCIKVLNGWLLTVPLKDIPGLSILKLSNIVAMYVSKFLSSYHRTFFIFRFVFRQIQLSLFHMGNICVTRLPLLDTHNEFSGFLFLLFQGTLAFLKQFLTTESPLKMLKNSFYFTLKALFVLKILKFLSWLLVVEKLFL